MNQMHPYLYAGLPTSAFKRLKKGRENSVIETVCNSVTSHLKITIDQMVGASRKAEINEARQIAILIISQKHQWIRLVDIAKYFNRHHSTILYNRDVSLDYIKTNKYFKALYLKIATNN